MGNISLIAAKKAKNDEFYTQYKDVEKELAHYTGQFEGKSVYCNCDSPKKSAFWKYFHTNFQKLKLKKLVATHYEVSDVTYKMEYGGGEDENLAAGKKTLLKENGDFRSAECLALLDEADIVVTNPPFSLFREFIATLLTARKKFLVIGNLNAVTYKGLVSSLISGEVRVSGWNAIGFFVHNGSLKHVTARWYTNLNTCTKKLKLHCNWDPTSYPKYINYDAIEVSKIARIPADYHGVMGVPITFMDYYDPNAWEVLGFTKSTQALSLPEIGEYDDYIEMRPDGTPTGGTGRKVKGNAKLLGNDGKHNFYINADGRVFQATYTRFFIKRKL